VWLNTSGQEANAKENHPLFKDKRLSGKTCGFHILSCSTLGNELVTQNILTHSFIGGLLFQTMYCVWIILSPIVFCCAHNLVKWK